MVQNLQMIANKETILSMPSVKNISSKGRPKNKRNNSTSRDLSRFEHVENSILNELNNHIRNNL